MSTETVEFPRLTIFDRLLEEVPLYKASVDGVQSFSAWQYLNGERINAYLETAKGLSTLAVTSALERSRPYHGHIATAIETVDNFAHQGLDKLHEKSPVIFETQPEDVAQKWREQKENLTLLALKPMDAEFRAETKKQAFNKYVEVLEPRLSPLLDFVESKLPANKATPKSKSEFQYERALELSKNATGTVLAKSTDQLKLLQEKNALVKKAAESAGSLSQMTSTTLSAARERWPGISEVLLAEFNKIKELSAALSATLTEKAKERAQTLPPPVQESYKEFIAVITPLVEELREVAQTEGPAWTEKLPEMGRRLKTHAVPQMERLKERVPELKEKVSRGTDSLRTLPERVSRGKAAFFEHKA